MAPRSDVAEQHDRLAGLEYTHPYICIQIYTYTHIHIHSRAEPRSDVAEQHDRLAGLEYGHLQHGEPSRDGGGRVVAGHLAEVGGVARARARLRLARLGGVARHELGLGEQHLRLEVAVGAVQVHVPEVGGGARVVVGGARHLRNGSWGPTWDIYICISLCICIYMFMFIYIN